MNYDIQCKNPAQTISIVADTWPAAEVLVKAQMVDAQSILVGFALVLNEKSRRKELVSFSPTPDPVPPPDPTPDPTPDPLP